GAYAHQDIPFEKLVEQLQPQRDLSRQSLFQVMFVLQNVPHEVLELPGLRLTPAGRAAGSAKFDLLLELVETDDGLRGSLGYATDLFDRESMERLAGAFHLLLEGIV
ncbi:condensation domain-containing protein, partial [Rhizobium leguminosarum]|uniref:condensation domain-containing protein n=1 Tax=Rhizobium leguminosarum TaxID=384 RepID=UPI003F97B42F